jgi:sugar lactone lactonase YvrE
VSEPSVLVASERAYGLGEGPVWDAERGRILWVDIDAGEVHTGTLRDGVIDDATPLVRLDETVGAVACAPDGRLLVAGARDLHAVDPDGRRGQRLVALIDPATNSRLNDGACDPAGRFLVGSMALDDRQEQECLYRLRDDGQVAVIDDDLTLSNGLGWSPDGSVLYSVDTTPGIVWSRPYEPASGACGARACALNVADGSPDGLCVDVAGNLWIAIWGAGEVRCHAPTGELRATVAVPAPNTSSVAFVGPALDTLLITTAREDLTAAQLAEFPLSGHLFTARLSGVAGLPTTAWAGPLR